MPPELSVIVPTLNERGNVRPILAALTSALQGIDWEAVFVDDDSSDGTADEVRKVALNDSRVRVIQRVDRRGLSAACIEGMMSSSAPFLAVIDADMQHDERLLPSMLKILKEQNKDLVIGSRYMKGGGTEQWIKSRERMSRFAGSLSRVLIHSRLSDPMSGFFMLRSELLHRVVHELSGKGFKILLDIFSSAGRNIKYAEVPYNMRSRQYGDSKLDTLVMWEYVLLLLDKSVGQYLPVRFLMFILVGFLGACFHLLALGLMLFTFQCSFGIAQAAATAIAMTSNYFLNNVFTYRDNRQRGWRVARGLAVFYLSCSIGAFVNVKVANSLYLLSVPWWGAGMLGAMISAVWNFSVTSATVWSHGRRQRTAAAPDLPPEAQERLSQTPENQSGH